ncbi:uncharacterized protein LOC126657327 isoform X2 [Mercurialis annua]|uniref:uncharacterized protein LOC126657327 isoform X2 n=1 Tax=Mercurialis annua TaxID=3986 RepID=UPI0021603BD9|nr:uncharacterized protein LOC126657327 isoform X2 [Mercurialis annua]
MENPEPNSISSAHNNEGNPNCMLWPCENEDFKCEISNSEKIIRDIDQKHNELSKTLEKEKIDHLEWARSLSFLRSGPGDISHGQKYLAHPLKQVLEKLSFKNNTYHGRAIKSFLSKEDEEKGEAQVNFKNLDFKMQHGNGNKNMVAKKRFLQEIKRKNSSNSNDFLESINKEISLWRYGYDNIDAKTRSQKMKELEFKRDIAITNATVKGQSWWKFLGSKEEIQDKINMNEKHVEKLINRRLHSRSYKFWIKKLKTIERQVDSIESQMEQAKRRKEKAYKHICLLIKQHEEKDCCCFEHLATLNNAREIIQKKDVTATPDRPAVEYSAENTI